MHLGPHDQSALLNLARRVIRQTLEGTAIGTPDLDGPLAQPAGCFVSLHQVQTRRLRGCVGRIDASHALSLTVQQMSAGVLSDPRFIDDPVRLEELCRLELEISVLSALRPANHCLEFDPSNDGIYLTLPGRAGCFLPQVARETGWAREQLLDRLCTEKMGLPPLAWQKPEARLHTFSTLLIGPEPFEIPTRQVEFIVLQDRAPGPHQRH